MKLKTLFVIALISTIFLFLDTGGGRYLPVRHPIVIKEGQTQKTQLPQQSIKILDWNIHKENNKQLWQSDFQRILRQKKPDIITLQETSLEADFLYFLQELNLASLFAANLYQTKVEAYAGVMTLSQVATLTHQSLLSNQLEPIAHTPKVALFSTYQLNQSHLLVINVHLLNFQLNLNPFKEQLQGIFEIASRHQGPIILIGDFNTWNEKRIAALKKLTQQLSLIKVDFKNQSTHIKANFGHPLDAIFYSVEYFNVIDNSADVIENKSSSDHEAIFVELQIRLNK